MEIHNAIFIYSFLAIITTLFSGKWAEDSKRYTPRETFGIAMLFGWLWPIMIPSTIVYLMIVGMKALLRPSMKG